MVYVILLVALVLRIINLSQSLWLDEAISINIVKLLSFKSIIFNFSPNDFHPPLFYLMLKAWKLVFGMSEISMRMPSVILGVATIYVVFLIGKKLYEEKTGLIAATLLATAPLHIYYSQEARMYMLAAFLASLSVYFFITLLNKGTLANWLGFIIATVLMLYSDYLPYLLIPTYIVYLFYFRKKVSKQILKSFFPAFLLILIFIVPWLLIFPSQLKLGLSTAAALPAWSKVVGSSQIKDLGLTFVKFTIGRISNDNNVIYALLIIPVALYVSLLFLLSLFRLSPKRLFLWLWLLIPIFSAFVISQFVPVFTYFRFIFVLAPFYIIWASAINTVNIQKLVRALLFLALAINLISVVVYFTNSKFQRENWREATAYVHKSSVNNAIVLFESNSSMAPFDYYNQNKVDSKGALGGFSSDDNSIDKNLDTLLVGKDQIFLFQYLSEITDPQGILFEEITKKGYMNTSTHDFVGVGFVYEFKRQKIS